MNEQKSHYVYGILVGVLSCAVSHVIIKKTKIYDAWLTDFVWWVQKCMANKGRSLISDPVVFVIICSREYVKQNSKYDLARWGISLLIVFAGLCLKIS